MEHLEEQAARVPLSCAAEEIEVSVIMPAFNAAGTIARAIDSVRAQRGVAGIEIIVVNDGSSDDTAGAVRAATGAGEQVLLHNFERNQGVSAARNAGIARARGKYLAFLDADDVWLRDKLCKQVALLKADPALTLVSCNSQMTSPDGRPLKEGHVNRPPSEGPEAWKTLLVYNFLPTPTVLTYTALVRELGGFDEQLAVGEDLDLWIKLGIRGKIAVLPDILVNYYDLNNSLMKRHHRRTAAIVLPMLERHIREQHERLSRAEVRAVRGQRSFQTACDMFFSGAYRASVPLFARAALYGTRPVKSLSYLPRALVMELIAPGARALGRHKH